MPLQANEQSPIHAMVQSDVMALSSLQRSYPYTIKAYRFDSNGDIQAIFGTGDGYLKGVAHANGQAWFTGTRTDQYVDAVPGEYKNAWRVDNSGVIQAAADLPTVRPGGTSEEEAAFDKIGYDGTGLYVPYSGFVPIKTETSGDIINTTLAHAYLYEFNSNGVYVSNRIISEFAISATDYSYEIVIETQSHDIYIPHFKWKRRARGENPHFPHIWYSDRIPALWGNNPWVYAFSVLDAQGNEIVPGEFIYNRSEQIPKLTYSIKLRQGLHRLKIVGGDYLGFGIYCFATDGPGLDINQSWRMSRYLLYWSGAFVGQYHFLHDFRGESTGFTWGAYIDFYEGLVPKLIKNPDGDICTLDEPEIYGVSSFLRIGFWTTARIGDQFVGVAFQDSKDGLNRLYSQRALDDFEHDRVKLQYTTKAYNGIQILYFSGTARRGYFLITITSPTLGAWEEIKCYIVSSDFSARLEIPRDPNALYPFPTYISSDGYTCAYVIYYRYLTQGTITIVQHNIGTSEINQISSFAFPPSGYTGRLRRLVVHGGYYWLLGDWTAGENEYVILICDINGNVVKTHERVAGSAWGQQAPQVAHDPDTDSIWIITNGEIMEYA